MAKSKLEQYNQAFKKALPTVIYKKIPDVGQFSITDVLIDPSLMHGRVWISANPVSVKRIEEKRIDIQNDMQRYVKTRYTPKLTFIIDDNYLNKIDNLFNEIENASN